MRKLFTLLTTLALLCAVGCEEQGDDNVNPNDKPNTEQPGEKPDDGSSDTEEPEEQKPENIFFGLDRESVSISPDGGSVDVVVYSNYKWEISGTSDWCTPSATSGEANEDGQKVTFSADMTYDTREAIFWFRCADEKIKFVVSQNLKEVIIADENNTFSVSSEGGIVTITYQTSIACEVIIPDEAKEWITFANADATRGLVAENINLNIAENTTYSARSAVIKVVKVGDNTLFAEYTINQVQNDAIIADENNIFNVPAEGGVVEVAYQTNVECEIIIPEETQSWISLAPATRALVSESATLTVAENTTYSERSAVIKVVAVDNEDLVVEYTINQVQNDAIIADKNNTFNLKGWAQSINIAYKTNVECEVVIPEEAKSWISLAPATRALVDESATLNIAENNTGAERSAVVKVVAANNNELFAEYTITQNQRYFMEYTSKDGLIVRPYNSSAFGATIIRNEYIDGKGYIEFDAPITSIGSKAFYERSSLTSITIPDSVTTIGKQAFANCTSLISITIGNGVTTIGEEAFYECTSLTSVTIGDSVTTIGGRAFYNCTSLTSITIGNGVTTIGEGAFRGCTSLKRITIPDSVTEIGASAFHKCTSLTSITIPDSVTTIGRSAFSDCSSLTSVTIGNGVTTIGEFAFWRCSSLTSVTIGNGVTTIGEEAFSGCDSLTSVTIGNGVTSIGVRAFYECTSLTSITIPDSVTSIGNVAFASCDSLTSITIPDSVTEIGASAFSGCDSLTSVTIGNGVTSIGKWAFEYCTSLTSVTIGDSVTDIGGYAFWYCTSLTSVHITDIAAWCGISFGDSAANPLSHAHNLYLNGELVTNLVIPDSVIEIKFAAFYTCTSLTSVTIPEGVTSIREYAFYKCTSLTSVYCKPTTPPIGVRDGKMFDYNASGRKIYVPTESVNAYKDAWSWYNYKSDIVGYDFE